MMLFGSRSFLEEENLYQTHMTHGCANGLAEFPLSSVRVSPLSMALEAQGLWEASERGLRRRHAWGRPSRRSSTQRPAEPQALT